MGWNDLSQILFSHRNKSNIAAHFLNHKSDHFRKQYNHTNQYKWHTYRLQNKDFKTEKPHKIIDDNTQ